MCKCIFLNCGTWRDDILHVQSVNPQSVFMIMTFYVASDENLLIADFNVNIGAIMLAMVANTINIELSNSVCEMI